MFPEAESILIGRPALPSYKKRCWAAAGCGAVRLWGCGGMNLGTFGNVSSVWRVWIERRCSGEARCGGREVVLVLAVGVLGLPSVCVVG